MKRILLSAITFLFLQTTWCQMDLPAVGGNPRATVTEEVGITNITVKYSRPDVNKREGKIWGQLVHNGFIDPGFGTSKSAPWRAGANEATTISFEHDVKVEGKDLKAGTYGLFMAMGTDNVTVIFSNQTEAWGSFYYDEKQDALRVNVKPVALANSVEWLKYEFIEHKEKYCVIAMQWEKLSVPFKVEVDVDNIVLARLREQANSMKNFNSTNMIQASQWCFNKNINLEEAVTWAQRAVTGFNGQKSYVSLRNLATGYEKLQKTAQADSVMAEAITMATANQLTGYGRTLIAQKRADKALEVFLGNQKKNGDNYVVNSGLVYGYSAKADYKKALAAAEKAMAQAPNDAAKKTLEGQIAKLKEGKDINQ
jgi:hypothetical protein